MRRFTAHSHTSNLQGRSRLNAYTANRLREPSPRELAALRTAGFGGKEPTVATMRQSPRGLEVAETKAMLRGEMAAEEYTLA